MRQGLAPELNHLPTPDAETAAPVFDVIQGLGEGSGAPAPELYAVPDLEPEEAPAGLHVVPEVEHAGGQDGAVLQMDAGEAEAPIRHEDVPEAVGDDSETAFRRGNAAVAAGRRALRAAMAHARRASRGGEIVTIPGMEDEDDHKYRSRGGGSYIRQIIEKAIAKIEAKSHLEGCDCKVCSEAH